MSEQTESGRFNLSEKPSSYHAWIVLIAVGTAVGTYGVFRLLTGGTSVLGISSQLPWGILISTYVFLVLLSTGICIGVTSLTSVFGIDRYEPLVKRGVLLSLVTLGAGGIVIMASLGQPLRAIPAMLLSPNPASPMWWMIVLYSVYAAALVAEFALLEWRKDVDERLKFGVGLVAFIAPVLAGAMLGAIFGTVEARPYYGGMFASIYLLVTAVLSGVALMAAVTIVERRYNESTRQTIESSLLTETLAKYLGVMAGAVLLLTLLRYLYGLTATGEALALAHEQMLLSGQAIWTVGIGLIAGLVVPLVLMASPKTRTIRGVFIASVLVLIGLFVSRLEFVVGGQVAALVDDPAYEYPVVSYVPTVTELAVAVFGFAVFALLYTAGRELFDLDEFPTRTGAEPAAAPGTGVHSTSEGDDDD